VNSILSIRTYINTSIVLRPTILLSLLSSTICGIFSCLWIVISSCPQLALTWLAGITVAGLIMCSAITCPVALFIHSKHLFRFCPSFNFEVFEWQQFYEIWASMGSFMICPCVWSNLFFVQFILLQHLLEYNCWNVRLYWASICVDEIHLLLPVTQICIRGLP